MNFSGVRNYFLNSLRQFIPFMEQHDLSSMLASLILQGIKSEDNMCFVSYRALTLLLEIITYDIGERSFFFISYTNFFHHDS